MDKDKVIWGYTKTAHRQNGPDQNCPKNYNA